MAKYFKAFSLGLQSSMEYRFNFLLSLSSFIFPLTIQFFLWTGIFKNLQGDSVYGYTYTQMIAYSVFAGLISRLASSGVEWEVMEDIKSGGLNKFIIKPMSYLNYRIACFLGVKSVNSLIVFAIICLFCIVLNIFHGYHITLINIFIFILSMALSLIISFSIYFSLAAVAFWIQQAWGVFITLGVVTNIISGGIFPLDIFGEKIVKIFDCLPFKYSIFFPTNVLTGRIDMNEILQGLLIQFGWTIIMLLVTKIIWIIGMKKYIAIGG